MKKSIILSIIACCVISMCFYACKGQTTLQANPTNIETSNSQTIKLDNTTTEYSISTNEILSYLLFTFTGTGYWLVNHPTVLETSAKLSSLP